MTAVAGNSESEPSEILQRTFTVGKEIKSFDFEAGTQGWVAEKDEKGNAFERGIVQIPDEKNDGRGPSSKQQNGKNPESPNVFATVLNDYRKQKAKYVLTSPAIDLSSTKEVTLYWQQWFNTRGRGKEDSDEYSVYDDDIPRVEVSKDGKTWHPILTLNNETIEAAGSDGRDLRTKNAWHLDQVKIPRDYFSAQTQVRFVLESTSEFDLSFTGGWYVDDVIFAETSAAEIPTPQPPRKPQPNAHSHTQLALARGISAAEEVEEAQDDTQVQDMQVSLPNLAVRASVAGQ